MNKKTKKLKIKSILISQPAPQSEKSPYFDLAENYNLKVDFRPFIHVEGVPGKEFKKDRISILDHSAIIFTSRTAIDHLFRVAEELRITIPDTMKYFCVSESIAVYLQKYIVYRKRKIFFGVRTFSDLMPLLKKNKNENFLIPLSDIHKGEISNLMDSEKLRYTKAVLYRTVSSDLSDLADVNYDVLVFFSPSGIKSLFQNFPNFKQNGTKIASFGPTTAKAVTEAGLKLDIQAPMPKSPSMAMALENYIKTIQKK